MEKNLTRIKIEKRVEILEQFIKKHPVVWLRKSLGAFYEWDKLSDLYVCAKKAKSPEEYVYKQYHELLNKICTKAGVPSNTRFEDLKTIKEQLMFCQESFDYIVHRKYDGALPENLEKRMYRMGAGGVFGSPIEDFCEKYNVSKYDVGDIILKYGSMNKFRMVYIQYIMDKFSGKECEKPYLGKLENILVSGFDIASPDLILRNIPVIRLCKDILGDRNWFVNSNSLETQLESNMLCLKERTSDILRTCYRNAEIETMIEISRQYGLSRSRAPQIRDAAIRRLQTHPNCTLLVEEAEKNQLDSREMEVFIKLFFQKHDIFFNEEMMLDEKVKEEFLELHRSGIEKKRQRQERAKFIEVQDREKQFESQKEQMRDRRYKEENARAKKEILGRIKLYDLGFDVYFADNLPNISVSEWLQQPHYELPITIVEKVENKISQLDSNLEKAIENNMVRESVDYENKLIENLNLSVRAYNALKRNGVLTVGELLKLSVVEISDMSYLGTKSYKEIVETIHGLGLRFAGETDKVETVEYVFKCDINNVVKDVLETDKILIPIEDLGLSNRAFNALKRAKINSVQSLIDCSLEAIKNIENLGEKSFDEIVEKVRALGYEFDGQSEYSCDNELENQINELREEYARLNKERKKLQNEMVRIGNKIRDKITEIEAEEQPEQMKILIKIQEMCREIEEERMKVRTEYVRLRKNRNKLIKKGSIEK